MALSCIRPTNRSEGISETQVAVTVGWNAEKMVAPRTRLTMSVILDLSYPDNEVWVHLHPKGSLEFIPKA